ncbi:hypothetical protein DQ04_02781070 [Trypanosoma grayi]|uniref:hypothetical protein n=1 Tax=Trypanosoma grayi TaxID=71804 RepID=UPI0004F4620E|nr:hypothetical protein DQ04_02781070 [Trypanosoma grayi]KEG11285.1 hypothetical protein DQ04_02781070 [Trypanosoma grayi]
MFWNRRCRQKFQHLLYVHDDRVELNRLHNPCGTHFWLDKRHTNEFADIFQIVIVYGVHGVSLGVLSHRHIFKEARPLRHFSGSTAEHKFQFARVTLHHKLHHKEQNLYFNGALVELIKDDMCEVNILR